MRDDLSCCGGFFPDAVPGRIAIRSPFRNFEKIWRKNDEKNLGGRAGVPSAWKESGYVTILRRNWQLLPYPQILAVSGLTRRELRHRLLNDDFLLTKLGRTKPAADRIVYSAARDRGDRAAMRAAARRELATAKEMLGLVRRDSRLGYETSNHYIYVPNDFLEKILNCRTVLASLAEGAVR